MKISLKLEFPLIVILSFLMYAVLLFSSSGMFPRDELKQDLEASYEYQVDISQNISDGISRLYPDNGRIRDFIDSAAKKDELKITIFNMEGQEILSYDYRPKNIVSSLYKNFVISKGKVVYLTEVEYPYAVRNLLETFIQRNTLSLPLVLGFIFFLV